jgi:uncharacterized protein YciI
MQFKYLIIPMRSLTLTILLSILLFPFFSKTASAQTNIEGEFQMKQYFMVFLKAGSNRTQDSATAAKIQEGHLNNITRLFNEKKMVLAGPFMDEGMYKGIFIFDVTAEEEVKKLLQTDPAVKAGRLDYEIHPWYGPGNITIGRK